MKNVISVDSLATSLNNHDFVILDCTVEIQKEPEGSVKYLSGYAQFLEAHIPGARHADLVEQLRDTGNSNLFALPDPVKFRDHMAALGVGDETTVILYDRSFTAWATRVWWMLRWIGFDRAMILDGGLPAWQAEHATESGAARPFTPATLSLQLRPEAIATTDDVRAALSDDHVCLIDTLSPESFTGQETGFARPGHVTGAKNLFALSHFLDGRFKSKAELTDLSVLAKDQRHITYCGAGILASATAFLMIQLGYEDVGLYAASLQEWAQDPNNPMEV